MKLSERASLPLLAKELVELAARPRTYYVRVGYAVFLLLICWIVLRVSIPWTITSVLSVLGSGRIVLTTLDTLQNIGLQLVLPAVACGVFTVEKERNTLCLLFLTRLGPWTIIFEKFLSQLLLAGNFLLISLPVIAFGYALGGIMLDTLLGHMLEWLITSVVIVSASLLCSAYFRTTSGALLGTYALVFATRAIFLTALTGRPWVWIVLFLIPGMSGLVGAATFAPTGGGRVVSALYSGIPWMLASGVFIALARWFLVRRAFLPPRNPMREFLVKMDGAFERANRNSLTQGIVLIRPRESLPDSKPVAWRELSKRALGKFRYLFRILLVLELPVLGFLMSCWITSDRQAIHVFSIGVEIVMWVVLAIVTSVLSAGLICGERGRQTLDVLLATPMHGDEIVQQKMAGITRIIWILEVPLWTCLLFRWLAEASLHLVLSHIALLLIYPHCIAWSSMWCGLTSRSTIVAVVKSLLMLLWKVVGILVTGYFLAVATFLALGWQGWNNNDPFLRLMADTGSVLSHVSPLPLFVTSEIDLERYRNPEQVAGWQPEYAMVYFTVIQLVLLAWARHSCLHRADVLLKRSRPTFSLLDRWQYLTQPLETYQRSRLGLNRDTDVGADANGSASEDR